MRTDRRLLLTATVLASFIPSAMAQPKLQEGYLTDGSGRFVGSATPSQCWHTGSWTPALAQEPCDPVIKKRTVAATPEPEKETTSPAPAVTSPVAVAAIAPPTTSRINLSTDTLFGFNDFTLTDKGEAQLNELVEMIRGADSYQIHIIGHTDRIGSTTYNQKLSMQRANAVRDYLEANGTDASRIKTSGMGETEPMTAQGLCKGKVSPKLIQCLQPDRRVVVEIDATSTSNR
ncbi:OmpA family protein [Curvibacter sp. APW13]|uniref:OmpA family protein n=1 Tax=Curvibacter sp. APW13 TaxID=3077236 RepID=UPI0028DF0C85|nr:OmpA family protein [Curvibacter sp. APW13]MDT8992610.1 OmpA family protein [Curvibacter sp. APW13]